MLGVAIKFKELYMKVFVTGVGGQLGYDVMNELFKRGHECYGSDVYNHYDMNYPYEQLDITDPIAVDKVLTNIHPDVVIHCAAWTAVDAAEDEENIPKVQAINVYGTQNIASICNKLDCKIVYISTDYVFNGKGIKPWKPDCKKYAPLNVYGRTKLDGEFVIANILKKYFIVRIAWVFGFNGNNFVKTMINIGKLHDKVHVVYDQIGTPTYTYDLSRLLVDMIETEKYGYYHATNEGEYISWYDFSCEIFKMAGYSIEVVPVTTADYGLLKAARPYNSRLDKSKLIKNGFKLLPDWKDALKRYLDSIPEKL
jgi:dTDP-4-dehydrorhamnose reductase